MLFDAVMDELRRLLGPDADAVGDLAKFVSHPPKPEMGDLAFACFPLAKLRRRGPKDIAAELAAQVQPSGLIASASAVGPYLNFSADPAALLDATCRQIAAGGLTSAATRRTDRVMVEFSQPNTHKFFHVGHLRNVALGDSLVRIFRARGHSVVPANYYGDFGIDVAKCLWWLRTHPDLTVPDADRTSFLGKAYTDANEQLDPNRVEPEARARNLAEVRAILHGMEHREPEIWALYQQTRQWCLDEFAATYEWLGVDFEVDFFESEMEGPANLIVDHFLERGVLEFSDGAIVCKLEPDLDVPAMVRKSDGTSLYMTWDLALAKVKFEDFGIQRSLYVVGSEQKFHFEQLFLALRRMGYEHADACRHVAYELVVLPEGKMSSRKGTAIALFRLRQAVCDAIAERLTHANARVPAEDREETIRRIAVACLKYGMTRIGTNKRVVFSIDDWTNPEGDTGAYLLYSLARIRSIFRKAGEQVDLAAGVGDPGGFGVELEERALLNHLLKLPSVIDRAADNTDPSVIAAWCYDCARAFSRFWKACPVLKADPPLRASRLALIAATDHVMSAGLGLLGIEAVDAM